MAKADDNRWDGSWWIAGNNPDVDETAHGALIFDAGDGAQLRLQYEQPFAGFEEPVPRRTAFYGRSVFGQALTVIEPYLVQWTSSTGGGRVEEWRADTVLVGHHARSLEDFEVSDVSFSLHGLREWLLGSWDGPSAVASPPSEIPKSPSFRVRRRRRRLIERARLRRNMGRYARWRRLMNEPVPPRIELDLPGAKMVLDVGATHSAKRFKQVTETRASGWLTTDAPLPLSAVRERFIDPLVHWLLLALAEQSRVERITVSVYDPIPDFIRPAVAPGASGLPRQVQVLQRAWPRLRRDEILDRRVFLPRPALGREAAHVLEQWWDLLAKLSPADLMLFGVWNASSIYLENELLSLTSFAEAYHERLFDELRVDLDEHKRYVDQAVTGLPSQVQAVYREALRYAYRQTQRSRLRVVVGNAVAYVPAIAPDPELLVKQLVETRNHQTHWGPPGPNVVRAGALADVVQRLNAVIRINVLANLGIRPDALEAAFRRHYQDSEFCHE